MSSWNDDPAIEYILCASAHMVVTICIFLVVRTFLPCQVRMMSINLLLCNKYYVTAGNYTLWISYVSGQLILLNRWGDMLIVDMDMNMGMCMNMIWILWYEHDMSNVICYCSGLCDIYFYISYALDT